MDRLFIPTCSEFRDMLRSSITDENSKVVLFNPECDDFILADNVLYYKGVRLSQEELLELSSDSSVNKLIKDKLLLYGISVYLYYRFDLRNRYRFETTVDEVIKYLGISTCREGFPLVENLIKFSKVYGVIDGAGVFNLLKVREQDGKLIIISEYLHKAFNLMLNQCFSQYDEIDKYHTHKAYVNIGYEFSEDNFFNEPDEFDL